MSEDKTPFADDLEVLLADDASHARIRFIAGTMMTEVAVMQDLLMLTILKLQELAKAWEARRREVDPTAGKPGDTTAMAVRRPTQVNVARVPGSEGGAIFFDTDNGREGYYLTAENMKSIARLLMLEAERKSPPVVRN